MWISFGQSKDNQKIKVLAEVMERLETTERKLRSLDLEFSELYGKVRHSLGRIEKRAAIIEKENESSEGGLQDAELSGSEDSSLEFGLSPAQSAINRKILASRRRV